MTTAKDIATMLPPEVRKQFEEHYSKQDRINWDSTDGSCSRCGCNVPASSRSIHTLWHKNVSCQLWMVSQWPLQHTEQHVRETHAFQAVIASILGFMDPEGQTEAGEHVHEDGTTHAH
jgi:hypothetical protein